MSSCLYIIGWTEPDRTTHYKQMVGPIDAGLIPWRAVEFYAEDIPHSPEAWLTGATLGVPLPLDDDDG
jgi:hypothetical protein